MQARKTRGLGGVITEAGLELLQNVPYGFRFRFRARLPLPWRRTLTFAAVHVAAADDEHSVGLSPARRPGFALILLVGVGSTRTKLGGGSATMALA